MDCFTDDNLSPLVEAANALAALQSMGGVSTESRPVLQQSDTAPLMVVSEDESNRKISSTASDSRRSKRDTFPQRLMSVLNDPSLSSIITWLHHGRSFVILRPGVFTSTVLPKYFSSEGSSSTKYPSFTRKLNRWGFRQATRGPDTGAFHHDLFQRDSPDMCLEMVCHRTKSGERQSKKAKNSMGPPKSSYLRLTKDSLDAVAQRYEQSSGPRAATVSVSDDTQSKSSSENNVDMTGKYNVSHQHHISLDPAVIDEALQRRDELERMNANRVMLFEAYLKALQGN